MQKIRTLFWENRYFFIGYCLFLLTAVIMLAGTSKTGGFVFLNPLHNNMLDWFFIVYTNVGDGFFCIAVFLLLLLIRRPLPGWEVLITFLLSGLIAQLVKNIFPMPRPKTLLGASYHFFFDGITHVGNASFPSGHSVSAFGLATILSLFTKNKKMGLIYLFAAILVGYSRIYLGQHFLQDVFAGALIGVPAALFIYLLIDTKEKWMAKMKLIEQKISGREGSPAHFEN